ncbi:TetR/AcrR family transcriptional regulator [Rhodoferax ferrireducens]|uniref:TetR/AcrR family transcriptional regulator n=1 Tax=Rhodoferax ferrireducens TaxID=192843 RepID=UPI000E0D0BE0|nr:TetR/AcrR family transcriptional regulator [Rhodoferax ferrireducens]
MHSKPTRREITHERIVEVAARMLRHNGYSGVGVADVMNQAGLTHGGFYAHFASRDALLAEAVERAGRDSAAVMTRRIDASRARGQSALRALVDSYLSEAHLRAIEDGCVVAALSSEMPRQSPTLLAPSVDRVRSLIEMVQHALPEGGTPEQAMVIAGTLVGTLQLARTLGANAQGKAMLAAARSALLSQYDPA